MVGSPVSRDAWPYFNEVHPPYTTPGTRSIPSVSAEAPQPQMMNLSPASSQPDYLHPTTLCRAAGLGSCAPNHAIKDHRRLVAFAL
jgi:hypothetical protein